MTARLAPVLLAAALIAPPLIAVHASAQAAPDGAPARPATLSVQLAPATELLQQAAAGVRLEKWKGSSAFKDDTDANLSSIRHDLDATLPGLIAASDASPSSISAALSVTRNVDALYDVLLRVTERAKSFAPQPQSAALEQSLKRLEDARRGLYEKVSTLASAQDQQVKQLKQALVTAQTTTTPVAVPPPAKPAKTTAPQKSKAKAKPRPATPS